MPEPRRLLAPLCALLLAAAAPAHADEVVAADPAGAPISARAGIVAWSRYDTERQRYRLMLQTGASRVQVPIPGSRKPFDVSMGSDRRKHVVALYTRCRGAAPTMRDCNIYRYDVASGTEKRVKGVGGQEDEAWPAQAGDLLTFVRPGNFTVGECDVPYVKTLSSRAPARRLDRGSCARTTGMSIRGSRIAQVTLNSSPGAPTSSQVRVLSAGGGAARVLAEQTFDTSVVQFSSPNQSASAVWLTRVGSSESPRFVRIDIASRQADEVDAGVGLSGALARDERGTFWYIEMASPLVGCTDARVATCRLTRASSSPFSTTERSLTPALTITAPTPVLGAPFVLSGGLTRTVVSRGQFVRADAIPNAVVRLLRRTPPDQTGVSTFVPTNVTTATDAAGRWSITLPSPPSRLSFSAITDGQTPRTFAGHGTDGIVAAQISLTVTGGSFSGTVAPAQPGRTVRIQRLTKRSCVTLTSGQVVCNDEWATIADAPLDPEGTHFAATVSTPVSGIYSAALPSSDQQADPEAFAGRSPESTVGG